MTLRAASPGPQLGSGRLRVDAARAIAKLREYQLADRAAWILEAIRAAVASRATAITLRGDANDIWLEWQGSPWETTLLPRLFDELVSPEPEAHMQHARLLAGAVNSALGMNPAYVDVYAIVARGKATRVRYTPEVLAEPTNELGEAPLRHVAPEVATPPSELASGMLVHLRRRTSLQVLAHWFGDGPPELGIAARNCRDISVPITIHDLVLHREQSRDVLRVPLGEGLDGFIAVTEETYAKPTLEVAERGVVLVRYDLDVLGYEQKAPVPLRIFLDADRLPTNAARSQVRQDVHPISTGMRCAKQLVETVVSELAAKSATSEPAKHSAIRMLASNVAASPRLWEIVSPLLKPLAKLPLLRNACGQPRPLLTDWRGHVHTGSKPFDVDLMEWLGEVPWLETAVERLLLGDAIVDRKGMAQLVRTARRQRRAHRKFLAHATRERRVQTKEPSRVRYEVGTAVENSCVPDGYLDDVLGEICVYYEGNDGAVVLLLDGRQLERVEVDSVIPFDAVLDSRFLRPGERYRGASRDDGFERVQRAMRAAIVRAIETLVVKASRGHFEVRNEPGVEHDMYLVRCAISIAQELGLTRTGPLVETPIFDLVDGQRISFAELRNAPNIGAVGVDTKLRAPDKRPVVRLEGSEVAVLRSLTTRRIVDYERAAGRVNRVTPLEMAAAMKVSQGTFLEVTSGDLVGIVALDLSPKVHLFHCGLHLKDYSYKFELLSCVICVDSDRIVPNEKWTAVHDDAGLSKRSYREWELALVRAIASKLVGDKPPGFHGPDRIDLDDLIGGVLALVLMSNDPKELLGAELLARLRAAPILTRLGRATRSSIDDLVADFAGEIPHVEWSATPVGDFAPLVADRDIARFVSRLSGRAVADGYPELERRKRALVRSQRHSKHLEQTELPISLPGVAITVPVVGAFASGVVGLGLGFEIRVLVERRLFRKLHPTELYPLIAVVEIAADRCDETFEHVVPAVADAITHAVLDAVPSLIAKHVAADPASLAVEPVLSLVAAHLKHSLADDLRESLAHASAFQTLTGELVSLAEASPNGSLRIAKWQDTWLGPAADEPAHALDGPILRVDAANEALSRVIRDLHGSVVADVTADVGRLQGRRRMARGLLPTPKIPGVPAAFKRELGQLGLAAKLLGLGELGLIPGTGSSVLIHEQGVLRSTVEIDVLPAVQLAVEDPHAHYNLDGLRELTQELALDVLRGVLSAGVTLPPGIVASIARGVLSMRVPAVLVEGLPLFTCVDGTHIDWNTFQRQRSRFGDVWAVTSIAASAGPPLDPHRIVIVLDAGDIDLAVRSGTVITNARTELEQDAKARANQSRPRVASLELPSRDTVLAQVALTGDGTTGPRGIVAVLAPGATDVRGIHVHRDMLRLGRIDDVCKWPTLAVIDDARITPDRTWSAPKQDEIWQSIAKQIREASESALEQIGAPAEDALESIRITNHVYADAKALRRAPQAIVRGTLWLLGTPNVRDNVVSVLLAQRSRSVAPDDMAVGGWIAIHTEERDELDVDEVVDHLVRACHGKLVRQLMKSRDENADVVAAHVAYGLALGTVKPTETKHVEFSCFLPAPLNGRALAALLRKKDIVPIARPGTELEPDVIAFVDDGSELAKLLRTRLQMRLLAYVAPKPATRAAPTPRAPEPPPPPASPPVSTRRPDAPAPAPKKARPPHPLRPLADALGSRVGELGIRSFQYVIDDEVAHPMIRFGDGQVRLAGENVQLRAIVSSMREDRAAIQPALDALAAHIVSILNLELTDITDAGEIFALSALLSRPSGGPPRSRRSS